MMLTPEEMATIFFTGMEQIASGKRVGVSCVLESIYGIDHSYVRWTQVLEFEREINGSEDLSYNRFDRWKRCYEALTK